MAPSKHSAPAAQAPAAQAPAAQAPAVDAPDAPPKKELAKQQRRDILNFNRAVEYDGVTVENIAKRLVLSELVTNKKSKTKSECHFVRNVPGVLTNMCRTPFGAVSAYVSDKGDVSYSASLQLDPKNKKENQLIRFVKALENQVAVQMKEKNKAFASMSVEGIKSVVLKSPLKEDEDYGRYTLRVSFGSIPPWAPDREKADETVGKLFFIPSEKQSKTEVNEFGDYIGDYSDKIRVGWDELPVVEHFKDSNYNAKDRTPSMCVHFELQRISKVQNTYHMTLRARAVYCPSPSMDRSDPSITDEELDRRAQLRLEELRLKYKKFNVTTEELRKQAQERMEGEKKKTEGTPGFMLRTNESGDVAVTPELLAYLKKHGFRGESDTTSNEHENEQEEGEQKEGEQKEGEGHVHVVRKHVPAPNANASKTDESNKSGIGKRKSSDVNGETTDDVKQPRAHGAPVRTASAYQ